MRARWGFISIGLLLASVFGAQSTAAASVAPLAADAANALPVAAPAPKQDDPDGAAVYVVLDAHAPPGQREAALKQLREDAEHGNPMAKLV